MSKQRVRKISPVSAIGRTVPSSIYQSQSPFADLEGRLVAKRQSSINSQFDRQAELAGNELVTEHMLSGENGRIGSCNCEETAEFGSRTWYI